MEEWRPVFHGLYEVSNVGRVRRRTAKRGTRAGRIRKPRCGKRFADYENLPLWIDGKQQNFTVHSLVAEAFIGPRPDGMDINHKNGDKKDNRPENLEYVTRAENIRHAFRTGLAKARDLRGELNGYAKLSASDAASIFTLYKSGVPVRELSVRYCTHPSNVRLIVLGKAWKHVTEALS